VQGAIAIAGGTKGEAIRRLESLRHSNLGGRIRILSVGEVLRSPQNDDGGWPRMVRMRSLPLLV